MSEADRPAPVGMAALAAVLEPALTEAAGEATTCISLLVEAAAPARPGDRLEVRARVERATRSFVFVTGEVLAAGTLVGTGQAVFRR